MCTNRKDLRDNELEEFREDLRLCLMLYGRLSNDEANALISRTKICEPDSEIARTNLLHEYPYYWAMSLLYGKTNPEWHKDSKLWPPPEEYFSDDWPNSVV